MITATSSTDGGAVRCGACGAAVVGIEPAATPSQAGRLRARLQLMLRTQELVLCLQTAQYITAAGLPPLTAAQVHPFLSSL